MNAENLVENCYESSGNFNSMKFRALIDSLRQSRTYLTKFALNQNKIVSGSLVEYRGMVQDMFDPELFCVNYSDENQLLHSGIFRDVIPSNWKENPAHLSEREVIYLVPVPGESSWCRHFSIKQENLSELTEHKLEVDVYLNHHQKKIKKEQKIPHFKNMGENHPVPTEIETPCIIKLYDPSIIQYSNSQRLSLHDVVRVVGFVSFESMTEEDNELLQIAEDEFFEARDRLLVPRIHVVDYKIESLFPFHTPVVENVSQIRSSLLNYLSQFLNGDSLASEFLLLWLISGIACRSSEADDVLSGKLSLAITKFSFSSAESLLEILNLLLPAYQVILPEDLEKNPTFLPKKDLQVNRLVSSRLQVPNGCRLIFNETFLTPRNLNESQILNLQSLNRLSRLQLLTYDFHYFKREQQVDEPVLVLSSTSKPVLVQEIDCTVPVVSVSSLPGIPSIPTEWLNRARIYIEKTREEFVVSNKVELPEITAKMIESDFVELRQQGMKIGENDLHLWINLAKLTAASFMRDSIEIGDFSRAKLLDFERRKRLT